MNEFTASLLVALGRTTLLLAGAALLVRLVLWKARCSSPKVHRVAWCLVLLQGWLFLRLPVAIPWYEAPAAGPDRVEALPDRSLAPREALPGSESHSPVTGLEPGALESGALEWGSDGPGRSPADPGATAPARTPPPQRASSQSAPLSRGWSWPVVLVAAWLVGMGLLVVRASIDYIRFVRRLPPAQPADREWVRQWEHLLAEAGVRRAIPIRMTAQVGPILCRLPRGSELVLPIGLWRSLSPAGRLTILRHELAHWKRGDGWKSLLIRILALPHWFNPAAWWAVRRFEEAAEWACDREAAGADGQRAVEYARTLLQLGSPSTPRFSHSPAAGGRGLSARVRRLLSPGTLEDSIMKRLLVTAVALGLVVVCLLRFDLVAKESPQGSAAAAANDSAPANDPAPKEKKRGSGRKVTAADYDNDGDLDLLLSTPGRDVVSQKSGDATLADVGVQAPEQKVPLESLRYDGKSFAAWKDEWRTELKPERRAEAIKAFAAFGANGYGEEAAEAVLEVMRGMEMKVRDAGFDESRFAKGEFVGNKLIKQSALAAFRRVMPDYRITPEDAVKVLSRELKQGNRNGRMFAIFALRNMGREAQAALPALRETFKNDNDPTVRCCAYTALAYIADWSGVSASTPDDLIKDAELRELIKEAEPEALQDVLNTLVPSRGHGGASASSVFQMKPGLTVHQGYSPYVAAGSRELRPDAEPIIQVLLEALDSQRTTARHQAIWALGRMGREAKEAVPALLRAFKEGDPGDRQVICNTLAGMHGQATGRPIYFQVPAFDEYRSPAFDPKTVIPELVEPLDYRNPDDLRLMVEIVRRFGPPAKQVLEMIEKAAKDEDETVRRAAEKALRAIPPHLRDSMR